MGMFDIDEPAPSHPSAPFDDADADFILRTSDGVDFRVYKLLLSLASSVFKDMFSLPAPSNGSNDTVDGRPVVELTETSTTIHDLLMSCYPVAQTGGPPTMTSISQVGNLLEAARKYDMPGIEKAAVQALMKPDFIKREPLRVYAIACRQKNEAVARQAAAQLLRHGLLQEEYSPELETVDGGSLYCVLQYHKRCIDAAVDAAVDHTWIRNGSPFYIFLGDRHLDHEDNDTMTTIRTPRSNKYKNGYELRVNVHEWWLKFMEASAVALRNSPSGQTIRDSDAVAEAFASVNECTHCRSRKANQHLRSFIDDFANEVDRRMSEVRYATESIFEQGLTARFTDQTEIVILRRFRPRVELGRSLMVAEA
jgi:hypothetical protein